MSQIGHYSSQDCRLELIENDVTTPCNCETPANGDSCGYETPEEETPVVSQSSYLDFQDPYYIITLTGTNFDAAKGPAYMSIDGSVADIVTIDSTTQITCKFIEHPGYFFNMEPTLIFENGDHALIESTAKLTIAPPPGTCEENRTSSLAGGANI